LFTCAANRAKNGAVLWMAIIVVPAVTGNAAPSDPSDPSDLVRQVRTAYLARFKGESRSHTASDLNVFLTWCADRDVAPMSVTRVHLEFYLRWMQEIRRFKPSTVSRRLSVVTGFYRTAVIDAILEHSPAEYVRRPIVPPESPTLGLTLQFEALLTTARTSTNPNDFALVAMLGLLGLRIFEATGLTVGDLREEHGQRVLRVVGKGTRVVLVPLRPAVGRAVDRAIAGRSSGPILLNTRGYPMDRHAATRPPGGAAVIFRPMVDALPLRIFLASPCDLGDERDVVRVCVDEHNARGMGESHATYEVIGWERVRGTARRPQEAINELISESHFLVALFKASWGSEPGSPWGYTSGTEEELFTGLLELGQAEQPMRDVWVAFLDHPSPADQIAKLRRRMSTHHSMMYESIADIRELKKEAD
jgi:integrase/recombinase XerD